MSTTRKPPEPMARHTEAQLARDMGTTPIVELHGMVKVRAGQVIGVFVGPHDAAELLRVAAFNATTALHDGSMSFGALHGVKFFLLEQDMP